MDQLFSISLGGRSWDLPPLPFRIAREVQPALFRLTAEIAASEGETHAFVLHLSAARMDVLAKAAFAAISYVDDELSWEQFCELPFGAQDLAMAFAPLASAVGMRAASAEDAAEAPGE